MRNPIEEKIYQLEFKVTFTENNVWYLLGENPVNHDLIKQHRETIERDKAEIARLEKIKLDSKPF